jgi:hypothetical protein
MYASCQKVDLKVACFPLTARATVKSLLTRWVHSAGAGREGGRNVCLPRPPSQNLQSTIYNTRFFFYLLFLFSFLSPLLPSPSFPLLALTLSLAHSLAPYLANSVSTSPPSSSPLPLPPSSPLPYALPRPFPSPFLASSLSPSSFLPSPIPYALPRPFPSPFLASSLSPSSSLPYPLPRLFPHLFPHTFLHFISRHFLSTFLVASHPSNLSHSLALPSASFLSLLFPGILTAHLMSFPVTSLVHPPVHSSPRP